METLRDINFVSIGSKENTGTINCTKPVEIAQVGLIESQKNQKLKQKMEEQFWKPLLEFAQKQGFIESYNLKPLNLNSIGIDILKFYNDMKSHLINFPGSCIEFKSKKYPSIGILDHKGYIYISVKATKDMKKYDDLYNIDGFRCCPSKDNPSEPYIEITANGGTPGISDFYSHPYTLVLPSDVLKFLIDYYNNPNFIQTDVVR